jgi:cytochrome c-type biogenesis protein CcmH
MEKNPDNLEGWLMLGRTYFAIGQAPKALQAVERAYKLAPEDASVLIAYAEALAANNGNRLEGRPAELIRKVLSTEPSNPSARWLDGMLAYQETRFTDAASIWEAILAQIDPAGGEAQQMRQMIAEAKARAGLPQTEEEARPAGGASVAVAQPQGESTDARGQVAPTVPGKPGQKAGGDGSPGGHIQVAVNLDPAVSARAAPEDAVFVYARAAAGPPMPLAVQRYRVADLPVNVTLDDSMAMVPAMRLSAFPEVVVGARISKSGQATPQPGDLEGQTGPITAVQTPQVSVTIDRVRP